MLNAIEKVLHLAPANVIVNIVLFKFFTFTVYALSFDCVLFEPRGTSVAKFLVPHWEDIVDYDIGLSYRPARLHRLEDRYNNPISESTISHSQGLRIWPLE